MENKIKEILSNRADYYIDSNGKSHDIIRGHPDDIMDEIVKLFAIPDVVGRSEQLCPKCGGGDLFDIDDHYTKCRDCGFSFVGA